MGVHPEGKAANSMAAPNYAGTTGLPDDQPGLEAVAGSPQAPSGVHTSGDGFVCEAMSDEIRGGSGASS